MEGVRRAFYDEQDGIAVVAARHSPPPKSSGFPGPRSPDEDERLKKEHQVPRVVHTEHLNRKPDGRACAGWAGMSLTECGCVGLFCRRRAYVAGQLRRCSSSAC